MGIFFSKPNQQAPLMNKIENNNIKKEPQKVFKCLSLDGGGMCGIITLAILAEIESQLNKKIYEMFDFFSGTSIGAIMAMCFSLKVYSAKELLQFFCGEDRLSIFCHKRHFLQVALFGTPYYHDEGKKAVFTKYFHNKKISDLNNCLITTCELEGECDVTLKFFANFLQMIDDNSEKDNKFEIEENFFEDEKELNNVQNKHIYLKEKNEKLFGLYQYLPPYHNAKEAIKEDSKNDFLLIEAGMATSAAYPFFPIFKYKDGNKERDFVDGGFIANNPSEITYQFLKNKIPKNSKMVLISIANDKDLYHDEPNKDLYGILPLKFIDTTKACLRYSLKQKTRDINIRCQEYLGNGYIRIAPKDLVDIELDATSESKIHELIQLADSIIKDMKENGIIYNQKMNRMSFHVLLMLIANNVYPQDDDQELVADSEISYINKHKSPSQFIEETIKNTQNQKSENELKIEYLIENMNELEKKYNWKFDELFASFPSQNSWKFEEVMQALELLQFKPTNLQKELVFNILKEKKSNEWKISISNALAFHNEHFLSKEQKNNEIDIKDKSILNSIDYSIISNELNKKKFK